MISRNKKARCSIAMRTFQKEAYKKGVPLPVSGGAAYKVNTISPYCAFIIARVIAKIKEFLS